MQIKITTLNEDGSIAFEGVFGPNEASLILEVGCNYMLQQGALPFVDEEDDDDTFEVEGSDTVQ